MEHLPSPGVLAEEYGHVPQGLGVGLCRSCTTPLLLRYGSCGGRKVRYCCGQDRSFGSVIGWCRSKWLHPTSSSFSAAWRDVLLLPHTVVRAVVGLLLFRSLMNCERLLMVPAAPSSPPGLRTLVPRHENGDAHLDDKVDLKETWKAVSLQGGVGWFYLLLGLVLFMLHPTIMVAASFVFTLSMTTIFQGPSKPRTEGICYSVLCPSPLHRTRLQLLARFACSCNSIHACRLGLYPCLRG